MKFSDKLYGTLKWLCLVCLPALGTLVGIVLPQVGVSHSDVTTVVTIVSAVGTFIGTLIGISTTAYNAEQNVNK